MPTVRSRIHKVVILPDQVKDHILANTEALSHDAKSHSKRNIVERLPYNLRELPYELPYRYVPLDSLKEPESANIGWHLTPPP